METTGQTLNWMIFYLAHFKEWQEKIHEEITSIVPGNEVPKLKHRSKVTLLEAFCQEVHRHASFIMFTFFKTATRDFKYKNFEFPMGTIFLYCTEPSHHDESYWKDATTFRPERWLNQDNSIENHSHFIPFGIGKRNCPGEIAARAVIFLCLSTLIQRFQWDLAEYVPLDKCRISSNRNPPNYKLIFKERQ